MRSSMAALEESNTKVLERLDKLEASAATSAASTVGPSSTWAGRASAAASLLEPTSTMARARADRDYDEALLLADTHLGSRALIEDFEKGIIQLLEGADISPAD